VKIKLKFCTDEWKREREHSEGRDISEINFEKDEKEKFVKDEFRRLLNA
jgi:hypothetical protein